MVAAAKRTACFCLLALIQYSDCINNLRAPWSSGHRPPNKPAQTCGISTEDQSTASRIVGGDPVTTDKYPWLASLIPKSKNSIEDLDVNCGGTLISSRHVLSAAHCFMTRGRPENLYVVVFNLLDRCDLEARSDLQYVNIARVKTHPDFNRDTLKADIAVATLDKAVNIMPACLPERGSLTTGDSVVIGFGSTRVKSQSVYPCQLQEAHVNIFSTQQCKATDLTPEFTDIPGTFCAGVLAGGVDSCDGDSGGPLMTESKHGLSADEKHVSLSVFTVKGVVSFGEGCAREGLPGVYTSVPYYRPWIDSIIRHGNTYTNNRPGSLGALGQILDHLFPNKHLVFRR